MSRVEYGYIKFDDQTEPKTFKPRFEDYVFELEGIDIGNVKITYSCLDVEYKTIEDGTISDFKHKKDLFIELSGTKDDDKASVEFAIDYTIEELNTLGNEPTNITEALIEGEAFFKKLNEKYDMELDIQKPTYTAKDMKKNLSSLYVLKESENRFLFKLSVPSDKLFTFFTIDFKQSE